VFGQTRMETNTKANSKKIKRMAEGLLPGQTGIFTKVSFSMIREKEKAKCFGMMEAIIKATGKKEVRTA